MCLFFDRPFSLWVVSVCWTTKNKKDHHPPIHTLPLILSLVVFPHTWSSPILISNLRGVGVACTFQNILDDIHFEGYLVTKKNHISIFLLLPLVQSQSEINPFLHLSPSPPPWYTHTLVPFVLVIIMMMDNSSITIGPPPSNIRGETQTKQYPSNIRRSRKRCQSHNPRDATVAFLCDETPPEIIPPDGQPQNIHPSNEISPLLSLPSVFSARVSPPRVNPLSSDRYSDPLPTNSHPTMHTERTTRHPYSSSSSMDSNLPCPKTTSSPPCHHIQSVNWPRQHFKKMFCDRFTIVRKLGSGAHSRVFLVREKKRPMLSHSASYHRDYPPTGNYHHNNNNGSSSDEDNDTLDDHVVLENSIPVTSSSSAMIPSTSIVHRWSSCRISTINGSTQGTKNNTTSCAPYPNYTKKRPSNNESSFSKGNTPWSPCTTNDSGVAVDASFLSRMATPKDTTTTTNATTDTLYSAKIYRSSKLTKSQAFRHKEEERVLSILRDSNATRSIHLKKVITHGPDEEIRALVTTFAHGSTLRRTMDRLNSLDQTVWVRSLLKAIMKQSALALKELHHLGITHQDLNLDNMVLDNRNCCVTLIDFGFARTVRLPRHRRRLSSDTTMEEPTRSVLSSLPMMDGSKMDTTPPPPPLSQDQEMLLTDHCGSLLYASPELLVDAPFSGLLDDVWSLGVIFYVLFTGGVFPFGDHSVMSASSDGEDDDRVNSSEDECETYNRPPPLHPFTVDDNHIHNAHGYVYMEKGLFTSTPTPSPPPRKQLKKAQSNRHLVKDITSMHYRELPTHRKDPLFEDLLNHIFVPHTNRYSIDEVVNHPFFADVDDFVSNGAL